MAEYQVNIPWSDGTNDHFILTIHDNEIEGDETIIHLSSDTNNTGGVRGKILRFKSNVSSQADAVLNVQQQADNLIIATFEQTYSVYGTNQAKAGFNVVE